MVVSAGASNRRRRKPGAWPFRVVLGVALSVGMYACSGSSVDDDDHSSNPVTPEQFPEQAANAICGNLGSCCESAGFTLDRAACEAYVRGVVGGTPPAGTVWDSDAAGRCVVALTSVARACDADAGATESCTQIRRGTVPEGEPCTDDAECADIGGEDALCDSDGVSSGTVCMAPIPVLRGGLGDACDGTCTDTSCTRIPEPGMTPLATCYVEDRLVCDFDAGVCIPSPGLGEPCPSFYCSPGAHCAFDTTVCSPTKPLGADCEFSDECSEGTCDQMVCRIPSVASQAICTGQ